MSKHGFPPWFMALLLGGVLLPGAARAQNSPDNELVLELLQRIEQLETEVRQIRGKLELQQHHLETLVRERSMPGPPAHSPANRPEPPPAMSTLAEPPTDTRGRSVSAQPSPPAVAGAERAEFDAALSELREGRYPEAITAWRRFLSAHPGGDLAGDAQYWLGESYYLSRDYNAAKETFIALGLNHPQSARLPDALLKLGYIYGEQGETARARDVLQKLTQVYPNTQAASLAERRLQSLR